MDINKDIEHVQAAKEEINTYVANGVINPIFEDIMLGGLNLLKAVYEKYQWASSHKDCDYLGAHDNTLKLEDGSFKYLECPTYRIWKDCQLLLIDAGFKELI